MNKSRLIGAFCATVYSFITLPSEAALFSVFGGQAYYDSVADITWLTNANAAGTTMDLAAANAWAASLNIGGVTGWRLPDTLQPDSSCGTQNGGNSTGYNCTGSEMGNLFYNVLGGTAGQSIITNHNSNYDLFYNVLPDPYWSGTELASNSAEFAWYFHFAVGIQDIAANTSSIYAWAIHSGNVGGAIVPVPAALWLFASGLLGMTGITRFKTVA